MVVVAVSGSLAVAFNEETSFGVEVEQPFPIYELLVPACDLANRLGKGQVVGF